MFKGIRIRVSSRAVWYSLAVFLCMIEACWGEGNSSVDEKLLWHVEWEGEARPLQVLEVEGFSEKRWVVAGWVGISTPHRDRKPYVAMYDFDGGLIWENMIDLPDGEVKGIIQVENGFVLAGSISRSDIFTAMINFDGDLVWNRSIETETIDDANCIARCAGGFIVAGSTRRKGVCESALVLRFDESGKELWRKKYFHKRRSRVHSVVPVDDGFMLVGSASSYTIFLVKIDEDGRVVWKRNYKHQGQPSLSSSSARGPDDSIYVLGERYDIGFYTCVWLFDKKGRMIWQRPLGAAHSGTITIHENILHIAGARQTVAHPNGHLVLWRVGLDGTILGKTIQEEIEGMRSHILVLEDDSVIIVAKTIGRLLLETLNDSWISSRSKKKKENPCFVFNQKEDIIIYGEGFGNSTLPNLCVDGYSIKPELVPETCLQISLDKDGSINPVAVGPLTGWKYGYKYHKAWIDLDNNKKWDPDEPYNILGIKRTNLTPMILLILAFILIIMSIVLYKIKKTNKPNRR